MLRMPNEDPALSKDFRPLGSPLPRPQPTAAPKDKYEKTGTPGVVKNTETGKLETMIPTPSKLAPAPATLKYREGEHPIRFEDLPKTVKELFFKRGERKGDRYEFWVRQADESRVYYMDIDDNWTYKINPKREPKSYSWAPTQVILDDIQPDNSREQEIQKYQEYIRKNMEQAMFQELTKPRYVVDPAQLTADEKIDWQDWSAAPIFVDKNLFNEQFLQRPDQVFLTKEARMIALQKLTPSKDAPLFDMIKKTNPIFKTNPI